MDGLVAMVMGSFALPEKERAAWDASALDATRWDDWPEGPMFEIAGSATSVGELFRSIAESDGPSFLERRFDGDRVEITGILEGEEGILGAHLGILCAARAAAELGGRGALAILIPAFDGASKVTLDGNKKTEQSTVEPMQGGQVLQDEKLAQLAVSVHGWAADKQADPSLRRAPWSEGEARFWLDAEPGDAEKKALDGARGLSDSELEKLLADDTMVAPSLAPLSSVIDLAGLRSALSNGTPLARAIAIELYARARGDAALEPAIALASSPSKYLSRMGMRALGHMTDERAIAALERSLFEHPSEFMHACEGLARSKSPGADAAIARWIASDDFDLTGDDRERRFTRAQKVLEAAGARASHDHIAALFARFEDPKARLIVPQIVRALARIGGDAVEARGQELQMAMLGMGKALNQDHARRAELLRIDDEDSGGIQRYEDLDLDRLVSLLEEGFIHPQSRQNDAPSTVEMLGVMQENPEVRATGYAVVPSRPDYRVSIDGLRADLTGLPSERAHDLRALFEQLAEGATNSEIENDFVSVWWT